MSQTWFANVERAWRAIVFGKAAWRLLLAWLGLTFVSMLASVIPGLHSACSFVLHHVTPIGFTLLVWSIAGSYALTAAVSFIRRDIGVGVWMSLWALLLAFIGASGVRFVVNG